MPAPTASPWLVALAALALGAAAPPSATSIQAVPINMRGVWGIQGRCDVLADRLTITAYTAGWGNGPFDRVRYEPEDRAILWDWEGAVDYFVIGRTPEELVHNTQGIRMPDEKGYLRCDRKLTRRPWPPP